MLEIGTIEKMEDQASLRRFGEVDWDFPAQASESPFSAVHWHPCRFPSQIPAITIGRFTRSGEKVLDPFMGSATTLVEAQRLGRESVGVDINPVSCLLAEAKTGVETAKIVEGHCSAIKLTLAVSWTNISVAEIPPLVQGEKWYMPETLSSLGKLWTVISELTGFQRRLTLAAFSAILLPVCREDRHWGYVCDNTQPRGFRAPDVKALFVTALDKFTSAYIERQRSGDLTWLSAEIINADAKAALSAMPSECVDCVVTSPPYFGVADYVKAQRLTMEWMSQAIEPIRRVEIGARSKRHRHNALESYLGELRGVFTEVYRVLKRGRVAVIVFGQSPSRPDAQTGFVSDLREIGFKVEMERLRQIPTGRRQKPSLARETVLVLRK